MTEPIAGIRGFLPQHPRWPEMRVALRMAFEGSMAMALAFLTATLCCALQSIASRRATATAVEPVEPAREALTEVRRPVFLSRSNLL